MMQREWRHDRPGLKVLCCEQDLGNQLLANVAVKQELGTSGKGLKFIQNLGPSVVIHLKKI